MGVVHVAVARGPAGFTKLLVVKELRGEFLDDPNFVRMFFDEARLAARLNHPNVVQTIEVGSAGRRPFIAMEYIEGQSLQRLVRRARAAQVPGDAPVLPLNVRLRVLVEMLSALEYAHSLADLDGAPLGLVHRDVSPQNVLVTYEGHVKLVDFGIAKTLNAVVETRAGVVKGKAMYMAPEQAACEPLDRRADLFSAGLMLWEAVAERRPWEGKGDVAILRSLLAGEIPNVREARPDADPELCAVVDRATALAPGDRYSSALAMRDDLDRCIAAHDVSPASGRGLGALVSQLFAADRQKLQGIIDGQLRVLGDLTDEAAGLPSPLHLAMAAPVPSIRVETPSSGGFEPPRPPDEDEPAGADEPSPQSAPAAIWTPPPPAPAGPARWRLVGGAAVVLAAGLGLFLHEEGRRMREPDARSEASAASTPASAVTAVTATAGPALGLDAGDDVAAALTQAERAALAASRHSLAPPPRASVAAVPASVSAAAASPAHATARPRSSADAPASKPNREIDKDNPYAP
jgi:serine/threonine-protein kinase